MGKRGPQPKPTALRILHGDRKDRVNTAEPIPQELAVEPPDWMAADPDALTVWEGLGPLLAARGVLTVWDVEAFAKYCFWTAEFRRQHAFYAELEFMALQMQDKGPTKNPLLTSMAEADRQAAFYGARFGLTPSERAQIKLGAPGGATGEKDPARLLTGG